MKSENMEIIASEKIKKYYEKFEKDIMEMFHYAENAKKKLNERVETKKAKNLAERTESVVGPEGLAEVFEKYYKENKDRFMVVIKVLDLILEGWFGKIEDIEKRVQQGIKTSLMLMTEGVVVSPIDGLPEIKLEPNDDGTKYISLYYAGPIRAAGGTAAALSVLFAEHAFRKLKLGKFEATKEEIERV
jgi:DNA polymerase II large subunit